MNKISNENKKRYEQFVKIINKEFGKRPEITKNTLKREANKGKKEEKERQNKARKLIMNKKKKTVKPRNSCSICSPFVTSTSKTKNNNKK
jgi:hypothetical protein